MKGEPVGVRLIKNRKKRSMGVKAIHHPDPVGRRQYERLPRIRTNVGGKNLGNQFHKIMFLVSQYNIESKHIYKVLC